MKKMIVYSTLVLAVASFLLCCEKPRPTIPIASLPNEIRDTVVGYLSLFKDSETSLTWQSKETGDIFHPHLNMFPGHKRYSPISETLSIPPAADLIYESISISKVLRAQEKVDLSIVGEEKQDAFFVQLDNLVIGTIKDKKLDLYNKPITYQYYIILASDESSGKYKVIDEYPSNENGYKYIYAGEVRRNPDFYFTNSSSKDAFLKKTKNLN
jgi:hypothetical protein